MEALTDISSRVFWDNGFKSVAAIANADPAELVPILLQVSSRHRTSVACRSLSKAQPNKVAARQEDEEKFHEKLLAKAKVIADSANRLWRMFCPPVRTRHMTDNIQRFKCERI